MGLLLLAGHEQDCAVAKPEHVIQGQHNVRLSPLHPLELARTQLFRLLKHHEVGEVAQLDLLRLPDLFQHLLQAQGAVGTLAWLWRKGRHKAEGNTGTDDAHIDRLGRRGLAGGVGPGNVHFPRRLPHGPTSQEAQAQKPQTPSFNFPHQSSINPGPNPAILGNRMYLENTVSLVIPAHNEEQTIAAVVDEFRRCPYLDEILVVANNCSDDTVARAQANGARVIEESKPGYGSALLAGMSAAKGDILVLTEADGSFHAKDLIKLLVYLADAQMVMGTRTTKQLVEQGANMRFPLRWGNVFMAKFLQLMWLRPMEPRFTDVGCTFRALWRETFEKIRPHLSESGPSFSPEMMCAALLAKCRTIEVPVTYSRRAGGESKHSDTLGRQASTAWAMFKTIFRMRFSRRRREIQRPIEASTSQGR